MITACSPLVRTARITAGFLLFTQSLLAQADGRPLIADVPDGYVLRHETNQIILVGHEGEATPAQLEAYAEQLGGYAEAVRAVIGPGRAPDVRLVVVLDGSGVGSASSPPKTPHVNRDGVVFLYYYVPDRSDYLESAAHEIVHAYRRAAGTSYAGFPEEGLAQAIALQVFPEGRGFPRYGYPPHVVAGHLIARGIDLPMRDAWRRNRQLAAQCAIHSYAQRESFFAYLADRYGLDTLLHLLYDQRPSLPSSWERVFGTTFDSLAADWRDATLAQFQQDPEAEALAERYRTASPARFQPFCEP